MAQTASTPRPDAAPEPLVQLSGAALSYGERTLWEGLDLDVAPGEFIAVLGANGTGKTSLLKVILGLAQLFSGSVRICGEAASRGSRRIGYIPQQRLFPADTPMRGRDLVGLGVDGHRFGLPWPSASKKRTVDGLLAEVGAESFADSPVGLLSGGEQQRLRAAQALASEPDVLLCDEPLLSLDLHHQKVISDLLHAQTLAGRAVIFVTHEINPIIDHVDRVLYFAPEGYAIGTPEEVLTTEKLSALYGSRVDVVRVGKRIIVAGGQDASHHAHHESEEA